LWPYWHRFSSSRSAVPIQAGSAVKRCPISLRSSQTSPVEHESLAGRSTSRRRQRRKQLDWLAELRRKRGTLPHRKEEDLIHLYTTERTYDAIAQGDISALGLKRKFFIEAMVQNVIAVLN